MSPTASVKALQARREGLISRAMQEIKEGIRLQEEALSHDQAARKCLAEADAIETKLKEMNRDP